MSDVVGKSVPTILNEVEDTLSLIDDRIASPNGEKLAFMLCSDLKESVYKLLVSFLAAKNVELREGLSINQLMLLSMEQDDDFRNLDVVNIVCQPGYANDSDALFCSSYEHMKACLSTIKELKSLVFDKLNFEPAEVLDDQ